MPSSINNFLSCCQEELLLHPFFSTTNCSDISYEFLEDTLVTSQKGEPWYYLSSAHALRPRGRRHSECHFHRWPVEKPETHEPRLMTVLMKLWQILKPPGFHLLLLHRGCPPLICPYFSFYC